MLIINEPLKGTTTGAVAPEVEVLTKEQLRAMPYREFLKTRYWKDIAERVKARDGYRCRVCNSTDNLAAHHRTYDHHGEEHLYLGDLTTLCEPCHTRHHFPPKPVAVKVAPKAVNPPKPKRTFQKHQWKFFQRAAMRLGLAKEHLQRLGVDEVKQMLAQRGFRTNGRLKKIKPPKPRVFTPVPIGVDMVTLNENLIENLRTPKGGYNARTLALIGVSWPPKQGWPRRLQGQKISRERYLAALRAARGAKKIL